MWRRSLDLDHREPGVRVTRKSPISARRTGWVRRLKRPIVALLLLSAFVPHVSAGSLLVLVEVIDPSRDPAVRYLATERELAPASWSDTVRWSADASIAYDYAGASSITSTGSISVPIDAASRAKERTERNRTDAELAAVEHDSVSRDLVYGVLDLACRWGYLRAAEPTLAGLTAIPGPESALWRVRQIAAQRELDALAAQLDAHAPGIVDAMSRLDAFVCIIPEAPVPSTVDDLDRHPTLARLKLEDAQQASQAAFFRDTGGPELSIDGSIRYSLGTSDVQGDVRVSARVPFSMGGGGSSATGSVATEADVDGTRVSVRIDSHTAPPERRLGGDLEHRLASERAGLQYRIAGAAAAVETLQVQEAMVWSEMSRYSVFRPEHCGSLCVLAPTTALSGVVEPGVLQLHLEALGTTYELSRAQLELMRILAVDPLAFFTAETVPDRPR